MSKYLIAFYPYATQYGHLEIPDGVDLKEYVLEHWDEIKFDEPELDYRGTDIDFYKED